MHPLRAVRQLLDEAARVARPDTRVHLRLRQHVVGIVTLTLGVDLVSAALAFVFEHGAKGSQIKSFGSALFWTTTQLLTVSSQLPNPVTTPARILDVFMEIWAVTVVASLAAAFGAFLMRRTDPPLG